MFSGRWEGGDAVTLSSLSLVNSGLSDVEEGEFTFFKTKRATLVSTSRGPGIGNTSEGQKEHIPHMPL